MGSRKTAVRSATGTTQSPSGSDRRGTNRDETAGGADRNREAFSGLDLLVVGTFAGGGIHRYIEEQVDRLRDVASIRTHDMASPPIGSGRLGFIWGVLTGLVAMVRFPVRDRPDVTHVHTSHWYSFYRASVYVLFAKHVWNAPVVLHVHGSSFDEFIDTDSRAVAALQWLVFESSDDIIVLSDHWADVVSTRADADRIRVLPNAVDPSTFGSETPPDETAEDSPEEGPGATPSDRQPPTPGDEVPHVVFVSNLIERKGVKELSEALETLAATHPGEFRATVAGDGPLADRIERLAAEHDEITYLGYVSEERKRSLLSDGAIYVLPTYAEGLPIAMLEGMAGANAVVSTTVGSIPEVIDEDRGILTEPGDVDQLTEALERLVTAPERRARMAENNRRTIEERYSWDHVTDELVAIYETHV